MQRLVVENDHTDFNQFVLMNAKKFRTFPQCAMQKIRSTQNVANNEQSTINIFVL